MIDHDRAATLVRASKGAHGLTDADLARDSGLSRTIINLYLNRKIDLLPADVSRLLGALELNEFLPKLCGRASGEGAQE
jgi:transcriptional regulator with XRE-family HTH domain